MKVLPLKIWVQTELPPVDVLMVWYAYTLNPVFVLLASLAQLFSPLTRFFDSLYVEDCTRVRSLGTLRDLGERLLTALVRKTLSTNFLVEAQTRVEQVEVQEIGVYIPSSELQGQWYERTKTVYDPLDALGSITTHSLRCPECGRHLESGMRRSRVITASSQDD